MSATSRPARPPSLRPQLWCEGTGEDGTETWGGQKPKSPSRSSSGESESESEAEVPPPYIARRKVSFADAFGLDLVSVKEFDIGADSGSGSPAGLRGPRLQNGERYLLSRLFAVPSSSEELIDRLRQNKVELESVELLPDTTTIHGVVRVLNLSYNKAVYVRVTLDGWGSYFDLLTEYMPGSSDGETDCFSFRFTLMPPFLADGARVEFCLRYEAFNRIFWANNGGANYVLFYHCRGERELREKEGEREKEMDESGHKGKKSCLKTVRKWRGAERTPTDGSGETSEPESPRPADGKGGKRRQGSETRPSEASEKALAERRSRRRAARLAHIQDHFSQWDREAQLDQPSQSERTEAGVDVVRPAPELGALGGADTSDDIQVSSEQRNGDTYCPSAGLSLNCVQHTSSARPHVCEISTGASRAVSDEQLSEDGTAMSCAEAWEAFLNGPVQSDGITAAPAREGPLCASPQPSHAKHQPSAPGDETPSDREATRDGQKDTATGSRSGLSETVSPESDPTAEWSDSSKHARDGVSDYEWATKPVLTSRGSTIQEWEPARGQWGSQSRSGAGAPPDGHPPRETQDGDNWSPLATNPRQVARSQAEGRAFKEEGGEEKVKRDECGAGSDGLTFAGVRDELFPDSHADGGGAFQRPRTDEEGEPKQETEDIREEGNTELAKERPQREEVPAEALERKGLAEKKEPADLQVQTAETSVASRSERGVFDKEQLDTPTEGLDLEAVKLQREREAGCLDLLKEQASNTRENPEALPVEMVGADWNCESSNAKAQSEEASYVTAEVTCGRARGENVCTHSLSTERPCSVTTVIHEPPAALTNPAASGSSGPFVWTESTSESDPLLLPALNQHCAQPHETLRHRTPQENFQEPDGEGEDLAPSPRMAAPSVGKILLVFCSLAFVSRALLYATLVVIVITAYLHDLPVCFAIYLLPVCWWCGQGMKKQAATAGSVD